MLRRKALTTWSGKLITHKDPTISALIFAQFQDRGEVFSVRNENVLSPSTLMVTLNQAVEYANIANKGMEKHVIDFAKYSSFIDVGAFFKRLDPRHVACELIMNAHEDRHAIAFYFEKEPGTLKCEINAHP